jgi:hypothetical protein
MTKLFYMTVHPPPNYGAATRRVRVGAGGQSRTYLQLNNGSRAVKCCNSEYESLKLEFDVSTRLGRIHPLICPVWGIVLDELPDCFCEVHMKFMKYGSLAGIIDRVARGDVPDYWTPTNKATIIVTIVLLLAKLHSEGFPHGNVDLKSFLLNEHFWACAHHFLTDGMEGRACYQASEAGFLWEKTPSTDIFALGMVLYEVVMGRRAYQGNAFRARGEIDRRKLPSLRGFPSRRLRQVIRNCWAKKPEQPCTAAKILDLFDAKRFKILPDVDGEKVSHVFKMLAAAPILHQ